MKFKIATIILFFKYLLFKIETRESSKTTLKTGIYQFLQNVPAFAKVPGRYHLKIKLFVLLKKKKPAFGRNFYLGNTF